MSGTVVTDQARRSAIRACLESVALYAVATAVALIFIYPFYWMLVSAFRSQEAILSAPLRLIPENLDLTAFQTIASIGGTASSSFAFNSVVITVLATAIGVCATGLGAYALYRNPPLPLFTSVRYGSCSRSCTHTCCWSYRCTSSATS